jgi:hypothetical protein
MAILRYQASTTKSVTHSDGSVEVLLGVNPSEVYTEWAYRLDRVSGKRQRKQREEMLARFCDLFRVERSQAERMLEAEGAPGIAWEADGSLIFEFEDGTN